jgi:16S rRNA (uracil1498-N3)-methyltransferase
MECIFASEFDKLSELLEITEPEFSHIKALRLKEGESCYLTNGKNLGGIGELIAISKKSCTLKVTKVIENMGETGTEIVLALGILSNRDRLEFALEKAIELGITEFIPLSTKFSQKDKINVARLEAKAIATIKQCRRSLLPKIHSQTSIEKALEYCKAEQIILADENGSKANTIEIPIKKKLCFFVGPEGGFSDEELAQIAKDAIKLNLGIRRLRAETAAIAAISSLILPRL